MPEKEPIPDTLFAQINTIKDRNLLLQNQVCQNDVRASISYSIRHVVWCKIWRTAAVDVLLSGIENYQRFPIMAPLRANYWHRYTGQTVNYRTTGILPGSVVDWHLMKSESNINELSSAAGAATPVPGPTRGVTPRKLAEFFLWVDGLPLSDCDRNSVRYYRGQQPTPRPVATVGLECPFVNIRCQAHGYLLSAG